MAGSRAGEPSRNRGRRAADRRASERRSHLRRHVDRIRTATWDEQRSQFITRYLFGALGLAYFNVGEAVARTADHLIAINILTVVYLGLNTLLMLHAWRHLASPWRLRVAMLTDVFGVSAAIFVDANLMSPACLLYLLISLGNGMRYGARAFAEAAYTSFAFAALVFLLRMQDYLNNLSSVSLFFLLFVGIIVVYSYALMKNIDRARDDLETASYNEALTGLLNRRGLYQRAKALFQSLTVNRAPLAVLFADLDGFKAVNDAHGHDAGDRMLQEVARVIAAQLRASDVVSRFGGDEFVVILPDTSVEQAVALAKRLQKVVAAAGDTDVTLSLTIGIGLAPNHGSDLPTVLKAVDTAMYKGKKKGGRGGIRRADGIAVA
jgi:diguanylate cyclase (GGDEF)-like protein